MPALFFDEAVIASLVAQGYPVEEARDYGVVGCVELSLPGKSFFSTDAGLFNLPICLEMALNRGRRFGHRLRSGARHPRPFHLHEHGRRGRGLRGPGGDWCSAG